MGSKSATPAISFPTGHNAQSSIYSGTHPSSVVHSMKPSVLPLPLAVCSTSANSSVTRSSVKTQRPALVIRPLLSAAVTSTTASTSCTSWPNG